MAAYRGAPSMAAYRGAPSRLLHEEQRRARPARATNAHVIAYYRGHRTKAPPLPLTTGLVDPDTFNERKWDPDRSLELAARHGFEALYDPGVRIWDRHWAPYCAAADPHSRAWVERQLKQEQARKRQQQQPKQSQRVTDTQQAGSRPSLAAETLTQQRATPLSSVPRSACYSLAPPPPRQLFATTERDKSRAHRCAYC